MKLQTHFVLSVVAVLAILSLAVVLVLAVPADQPGSHGLSLAIIALVMGVVFALPLVGFCGNRASLLSIFTPLLLERYQRPPPALS